MSAPSRSYAGRQLLTFRLGAEVFGVDILQVQEIRGWAPVTRIPQTRSHVLGVLNLRGAVVPIIDLRLRFALASAEYNALTVIIVLSVNGTAGQREVGVVVDAVSEVVDVAEDALRPAPELGDRAVTDHISGLLTSGQDMVIMLDVDQLIGASTDPLQERAA
jgi:purine-binding chemotaxis protein CheW